MCAYIRLEKDELFSCEQFVQYLQESRIFLHNYIEARVDGSKFNNFRRSPYL